MRARARARAALGFAGLIVAAMMLGLAAPDRARAAPCANADATRAEVSRGKMEKALVCLINRERASRERKRLDRNAKLNRAAQKHTNTMLRKDCFRHRCQGEKGLGKRIERTGYLDGAKRWRYAENIGCALTARGMYEKWLDSRFNRKNMLGRAYRDVGMGAGDGRPTNCSATARGPSYVTFTGIFAVRRG